MLKVKSVTWLCIFIVTMVIGCLIGKLGQHEFFDYTMHWREPSSRLESIVNVSSKINVLDVISVEQNKTFSVSNGDTTQAARNKAHVRAQKQPKMPKQQLQKHFRHRSWQRRKRTKIKQNIRKQRQQLMQ